MNFVGGPPNDFLRFFPPQLFHGSIVVLLAFSQKHFQNTSFVLLFESIEVIDDDTDEQVQSEKTSTDDKDHKVKVVVLGGFIFRLFVDLPNIHCVRHDFHPAFEGGHLKQGQVSMADMVEVDFRVDPGEILILQ